MKDKSPKTRTAEDFMVPKVKTVSIFKKLLYQTRKGNIEWRIYDQDIYCAEIGETSIRLTPDSLEIYDTRSNLLDSLNNDDLLREDENLSSLYECARKSSLKVFEKLNKLEKTLDGIL